MKTSVLRQVAPLLAGSVLLLLAISPIGAQEERPASTVFERVDVQVVNVQVFVTDPQGNPVLGLTADDFQLFVGGDEVPISNFYAEVGGRPAADGGDFEDRGTVRASPSDLREGQHGDRQAKPPEQRLHVVVFVNNANIRPANRKKVFSHLRQFLDARLTDEASIAVVSLGTSLRIHSDFLDDRRAVGKILDELEVESVREPSNRYSRRQLLNEIFEGTAMRTGELRTQQTDDLRAMPQLNEIRAYAQEEYTHSLTILGAVQSFVDTLAGVPGRKALLFVSDGIANRPGEEIFIGWRERYMGLRDRRYATLSSEYEREVGKFDLLQQFQDLAQRANSAQVTMYVIDAESDYTAALRSAALSGGIADEAQYVMEANLRDPLESTAVATGGLRFQASDLLARQLGRIATDLESYYSLGFTPTEEENDRSRRIEVKLRDGKGFVIRHREQFQPHGAEERMAEATVAALLYHAAENPLGIGLEPGETQTRDDGNRVLPVKVTIPLAQVTLLPTGEFYGSQLSVYVTTKDRAGQPRPVQRLPFHFQVPADKLEEVRGLSAAYDLPLVLRPGDQQVAIGVRDDLAGVAATVRLDVTSYSGGG